MRMPRSSAPPNSLVQRIHHQGAHILVADAFHQAVLQRMAEGPVPHIVQQDRDGGAERFLFGDVVPFAAQHVAIASPMRCMAPSAWWKRVCSAPGYTRCDKAQLLDVAQPLEPRMIDQRSTSGCGTVMKP
jgi:hypothetical protein